MPKACLIKNKLAYFMKRKQLSNKDLKRLNDDIEKSYSRKDFFSRKDILEIAEIDNGIRIIFDKGKPLFFYKDGRIIPTLHLIQVNNFLPKVIIDMPAVKYIAKGADVMRPGIVKTDSFERNSIVSIADEKNIMPLAIGEALYSSEEISAMETGRAVKNLHYVGDDIWGSGR